MQYFCRPASTHIDRKTLTAIPFFGLNVKHTFDTTRVVAREMIENNIYIALGTIVLEL